jgi:hypothetical protein
MSLARQIRSPIEPNRPAGAGITARPNVPRPLADSLAKNERSCAQSWIYSNIRKPFCVHSWATSDKSVVIACALSSSRHISFYHLLRYRSSLHHNCQPVQGIPFSQTSSLSGNFVSGNFVSSLSGNLACLEILEIEKPGEKSRLEKSRYPMPAVSHAVSLLRFCCLLQVNGWRGKF